MTRRSCIRTGCVNSVSSVRSIKRIFVVAGCLALALASVGFSQQDTFRDTTSVVLVEVPTQVSAKGAPITGLTKDQFELSEGRKKQEISVFEEVDLRTESGAGASASIPVAARRHFLAFFDMSYSDPSSVGRAQKAAADLVLSSLHPTDLAGVATYSRNKGPQLVLGFTTDRYQIRQAIETLGVVEPDRPQRDPLGLVISDVSVDFMSTGTQGSTNAAGLDAQLEMGGGAGLGATARIADRARRDEQNTQISRLMDGLAAVAEMMKTVQGRKHVLFLSEGFDGELLFGTEDLSTIADMNRAVEEGRTQDVDNDVRFGDSQLRRVVDRTLEAFKSANCSIQAVDIGSMRAGRKDMNLEALQYMARETGGEAFANFNNLGDAMEQLLLKTSVTYMLGFTPKNLKNDGEYRELRVRLKGGPRGADVVHRPGYYPPKSYAEMNPFERRMAAAQQLAGGQDGGALDTSVIAAGFDATGKKYVPVLIEVAGPDLVRGTSENVIPVEIYAYAMDSEGAVRDFFVRSMGLDRSGSGGLLEQTGLKYWGHFDLGPGDYTTRVLVRNALTGASGLQVGELNVLSGSEEPTLLPPMFPEQPGKWVLGREEADDQRAGVDYPFMIGENPFIPAARAEIPKGGEAQIGLLGYAIGTGSMSADAQIFDLAGNQIEGGEIEIGEATPGTGGMSAIPGVFRAKKLDPGDYILVVSLKDLASNQELTSSTSIRVVG